jgi:hypothetical protein
MQPQQRGDEEMSPSDLLSDIHAKSEIRPVKLKSLKVDRTYQRVPSRKIIDKIKDDWNLIASELILVSDRGPRDAGGDVDGGMFVINGQHRTTGAIELGETELDARVINLRKEENPVGIEAAFRLQTGVRLGDKTFERFKAQLAAGDKESLHIVQILASCGTAPALEPNEEGKINAVAALERLYRVDNFGTILKETLDLIKDAWGNFEDKKGTSNMLKAVAWFIQKHADPGGGDRVDRSRFITKLQQVSAAALDARGRQFAGIQGGPVWLNTYRAMVELYNDGLSDRNSLTASSKGSTTFGGMRGGDYIGDEGGRGGRQQ